MDYQYMGANFMQGIGVLAVAVALIEFVWRNIESKIKRDLVVSLVFALGVFGTMSLPFQLSGGFVFDLRHVFLALSGTVAGIPGLLVTSIVALTMRYLEGGTGMTPGMIGICIAAFTGFAYYLTTSIEDLNIKNLCGMGITTSLALAGLLILPMEVAVYVFKVVGPSMIVVHLVGVIIAGHQLQTVHSNIQRERSLETESKTDPLTGLINRRAFEEQVSSITDLEGNAKPTYSLMVIDIDNFKTVNDTFGHASGDKVIQTVAKVLAENTPIRASLGRFGGEEFVMLVPNVNHEEAAEISETLRLEISNTSHHIKGMNISVTISAGYSIVEEGNMNWDDAFELADQALYRAKKNGRDQVVSASEHIESKFKEALNATDENVKRLFTKDQDLGSSESKISKKTA